MAATVRTFVAIEITPPIRKKCVRLQQRLSNADVPAKWIERENLHITLKFLGNIDIRKVTEVCEITEEAAGMVDPFDVYVRGVGAFPDAEKPRVVWGGVEGDAEPILTMHRHLDRELRNALGIRSDGKKFRPHLTVGRIRHSGVDVTAAFKEVSDWQAGEMPVDFLTIFQSELSKAGAEYTRMGRFQIGR